MKFLNRLAPALLLAVASSAPAATLDYGTPFNIEGTQETDVLNAFAPSRNGGTGAYVNTTQSIHQAFNYGYGSTTVNGVSFTNLGGSTDFWGTTGMNANVDRLLSGHTALASGVSTGGIRMTNLVVGNTYQFQFIVGHDTRTTIRDREYEVSFGEGDFTSGGLAPVLTRYASRSDLNPATNTGFGTVVGTFVATSQTQVINIRSNTQDGNLADDVDPATSGWVVIEADHDWVTLIDENFTSSPPTSGPVVWSDSTGGGFERYGAGSDATVRDMNSQYDHDNNPSTAAINIPGALEVNDSAGQVTLRATLDLPDFLDDRVDGALTFFAGFRDTLAGNNPTVEVYNVTDGRSILAATNILFDANDNVWNFNSLFIDFIEADAGDTVEVRWYGGGNNGANGLQLADVEFRASIVPAPAALPAGLALITVTLARRRRR